MCGCVLWRTDRKPHGAQYIFGRVAHDCRVGQLHSHKHIGTCLHLPRRIAHTAPADASGCRDACHGLSLRWRYSHSLSDSGSGIWQPDRLPDCDLADGHHSKVPTQSDEAWDPESAQYSASNLKVEKHLYLSQETTQCREWWLIMEKIWNDRADSLRRQLGCEKWRSQAPFARKPEGRMKPGLVEDALARSPVQ